MFYAIAVNVAIPSIFYLMTYLNVGVAGGFLSLSLAEFFFRMISVSWVFWLIGVAIKQFNIRKLENDEAQIESHLI